LGGKFLKNVLAKVHNSVSEVVNPHQERFSQIWLQAKIYESKSLLKKKKKSPLILIFFLATLLT
jgi:hypothetical protein